LELGEGFRNFEVACELVGWRRLPLATHYLLPFPPFFSTTFLFTSTTITLGQSGGAMATWADPLATFLGRPTTPWQPFYVHLFKLVNLAGAGLTVLLIPALFRGHLLNQFTSFLNTKSKERTSSSSIYMLPG
jgi:hypothetical protein